MAVQHALSAVELSVWMWPVCADTPGSTSSKSQKLMKLMFHPPDANWKRVGGGGGGAVVDKTMWFSVLQPSEKHDAAYETTDIL